MSKSSNSNHLKDLFEFLSMPSISAQSGHKNDMQDCAKWLEKKLTSIGFKAKIMKTHGHPVVYAENLKAGKDKPTVLIYGHYDVQDVGDLQLWKSDPFKPEIRNGNIYARGAADDKGQLYTWIASLEELQRSVPCNIKFLIEGEEEVASKNLDWFIQNNKQLLKSDVCIVSDTHCLSETQPVITRGLRGIIYFDLIINALEKDVHSGTYGGNVNNPINILSSLIHSIKNSEGKITIKNFYNDVRILSDEEVKLLKKFPFTEKQVIEETGAKAVFGESNFPVQVRISSRPTFDVCGIWGGYQGEGPKTIIPKKAGAKLSFRLVPNQDVKKTEKLITSHIKHHIPKGVDHELIMSEGGSPILFETDSKYFKAADKAYSKIFKNNPLYFAWGGSIPVTAMVKKYLGIDSVLMGYGLPDDNLHSPNEKLSISMFEKGIKTNIEFLKSLN